MQGERRLGVWASDIRGYLVTLSIEELKLALPPVISGIFVFTATVLAAAYVLSRKGDAAVTGCCLLALAAVELCFWVPNGMGFPWTLYKIVPFVAGVGAVVLLGAGQRRLAAACFAAAVLAYSALNLASPHGLPTRHDIFKEPEYVEFLRQRAGFSRLVAGDGILMPNQASAWGLYDARYINSMSVASYQNYVDNHLITTPYPDDTDRLWFTGLPHPWQKPPRPIYEELRDHFANYSYLGVKYILTARSVSLGLRMIYDKEIRIYENPDAFPRAYLVRSVKSASSFQAAQQLAWQPEVDLKKTVILEQPPPAWFSASGTEDAASTVRIEQYAPRKVSISAHCDADGILVLSDVWCAGWEVSVDNQREKLYRANGLVRAVFLRQGEH